MTPAPLLLARRDARRYRAILAKLIYAIEDTPALDDPRILKLRVQAERAKRAGWPGEMRAKR